MTHQYVGVAQGTKNRDLLPQFLEICLLINSNLVPGNLYTSVSVDGAVHHFVSSSAQFIVKLHTPIRLALGNTRRNTLHHILMHFLPSNLQTESCHTAIDALLLVNHPFISPVNPSCTLDIGNLEVAAISASQDIKFSRRIGKSSTTKRAVCIWLPRSRPTTAATNPTTCSPR